MLKHKESFKNFFKLDDNALLTLIPDKLKNLSSEQITNDKIGKFLVNLNLKN